MLVCLYHIFFRGTSMKIDCKTTLFFAITMTLICSFHARAMELTKNQANSELKIVEELNQLSESGVQLQLNPEEKKALEDLQKQVLEGIHCAAIVGSYFWDRENKVCIPLDNHLSHPNYNGNVAI